MSEVRVLEKRRVFDDVFKIDEAVVEYRTHDGSWKGPTRHLTFERGDSVAALLVVRETGNLLLVRQFRYPTYAKGPGWLDEIVAGGLREDETAEEAMVREIREETGYEPLALEHIVTFYASPGGMSERIILFHGEVSLTKRRAESGDLGVGGEDIELIEKDADTLWSEFTAGTLRDGKTILALLWHRLEGRGARASDR
jgi:ADP-ribose pyrophosphatase